MSGDNCCISDHYLVKRFTTTTKFIVVIMALFNDQRQQQEEQQNQLQQYGVCVGTRRVRTVQRVPYVPDMNMGGPLFRLDSSLCALLGNNNMLCYKIDLIKICYITYNIKIT